MRRLALLLTLFGPCLNAQSVVRVLIVKVAVRPTLDSMAADLRRTNIESARVVTRSVDTTEGGRRVIVLLRLDSADVVKRDVRQIDYQVPGNTDSLPTIHTHREAWPWDVRPSLADTLFAEHRPAKYQLIVTDSARLLIYGLRP